MIPIRDNIVPSTTPFVNYVIIAICSLAFFAQLRDGIETGGIAEAYGMVPYRVSHPDEADDVTFEVRREAIVRGPDGRPMTVPVVARKTLSPPGVDPIWTFLTCMFLHGGWMHFLGNVWFLYIFGDNVEDRLGHIGFAALYLGTGVAAGVAHYLTDPSSPIPTIGASGAIAGVMGAYAWFYPRARVQAVFPVLILLPLIVLPAPIFLGMWFLLQMFSGVSSLGGTGGGVAWWAHIGGFVAGIAAAIYVGRHRADQSRGLSPPNRF